MPARRLFVSGAVSAPTFPTPFVVSVFYEPSGRWRDVSFLTLHNGPAVKRGPEDEPMGESARVCVQ